MKRRREPFALRGTDRDSIPCINCDEIQPESDLDRMLWCVPCRKQARERAGWWGWLGGILFGAAIALYIWLGISPSGNFLSAWFGVVAMAVWLGSKACREIAFGVIRYATKSATSTEAASADGRTGE